MNNFRTKKDYYGENPKTCSTAVKLTIVTMVFYLLFCQIKITRDTTKKKEQV